LRKNKKEEAIVATSHQVKSQSTILIKTIKSFVVIVLILLFHIVLMVLTLKRTISIFPDLGICSIHVMHRRH
jgi:hypothetical protein